MTEERFDAQDDSKRKDEHQPKAEREAGASVPEVVAGEPASPEAYSDEGFWEKVKNVAISAGREVIEKALILYYILNDRDTPTWAKMTILSALAYFILPVDAVPDFIPVAGFSDDLSVLAAALVAVAAHVKEEHKRKAQETLSVWFD